MKKVSNIVREPSKKLKYAALIFTTLMITVDANAEWNLSKQIGDAISTPIKDLLNEWNFWISLVIGGSWALLEKGDVKKTSIVAAIGFFSIYVSIWIFTYFFYKQWSLLL